MALLGFTLPPDSGEKLTLGEFDFLHLYLLFVNLLAIYSCPRSATIFQDSPRCVQISRTNHFITGVPEPNQLITLT